PTMAGMWLARWTLRRRLPWLAGAGVMAAACIASAVLIWLLAATFSEPLAMGESALGAVMAPVVALLTAVTEQLRARFLDPAWFTGLVLVAAAGCAGFAALYRQAGPARMTVSR